MRKKNRWRRADWQQPAFAVFFNGGAVSLPWLCHYGDVNISKGDPGDVSGAVRRSAATQNALIAGEEGCCRAAGGYVRFLLIRENVLASTHCRFIITPHYFRTMSAVIKRRFCLSKQLFAVSTCMRLYILPEGGAKQRLNNS